MKKTFVWKIEIDDNSDFYLHELNEVKAMNNAIKNASLIERWYEDSGLRKLIKYESDDLSEEEYDLLCNVRDMLMDYFDGDDE